MRKRTFEKRNASNQILFSEQLDLEKNDFNYCMPFICVYCGKSAKLTNVYATDEKGNILVNKGKKVFIGIEAKCNNPDCSNPFKVIKKGDK